MLGASALLASGARHTKGSSNYSSPYAAKFKPNGTLDMSFGSEGIFGKDFGYETRVNSVKIAKDGNIYLAGTGALGIMRITPDGQLDLSFADKGI